MHTVLLSTQRYANSSGSNGVHAQSSSERSIRTESRHFELACQFRFDLWCDRIFAHCVSATVSPKSALSKLVWWSAALSGCEPRVCVCLPVWGNSKRSNDLVFDFCVVCTQLIIAQWPASNKWLQVISLSTLNKRSLCAPSPNYLFSTKSHRWPNHLVYWIIF